MSRDYYDSNNEIPSINEEELIEVINSEDSEEFVKKSDTEESLSYKNM